MTDSRSKHVSLKPSLQQLKTIEKWLLEERNTSEEGFYGNWDTIKKSFDRGSLATIVEDGLAVGFATWYCLDFTARINLVEIKPTHRSKSLGKQLITHLEHHLVKQNVCVASLECCPAASEPIWRRFGFMDFPKHEYKWNSENKELYKVLIPHTPLSEISSHSNENTFELWNDTPACTAYKEATWSWTVHFKKGTHQLQLPIIHPCDNDWRVRWIYKGVTIADGKVKYLDDGDMYSAGFLVIRQLPIN